jgi:triosephosphate isomerase
MMAGTGWKMNLTIGESISYIERLAPLVDGVTEVDVFVVPSFTSLPAVGQALAETTATDIGFGAQNMFWEDRGAFTGEISPLMVVECGCQYVELGHWERRRLFAETDETIGRKARAAWDHGLIPIICIGEETKVAEPHEAYDVLARQLRGALGKLTASEVAKSVLAYEPAWAIGVGRAAAEPAYAAGIHRLVREVARDLFDQATADAVRIIYGGSVNPDNAPEFLMHSDIDGLFVGRAALDPETFARVVHLTVVCARERSVAQQ